MSITMFSTQKADREPIRISPTLSAKIANMGLVCAFFVVALHSPGARRIFGFDIITGVILVAVPFFFTTSGFLLAGHMREGQGWFMTQLMKRVRSLLAPFFLWNLSWIAFMFAWTFATNILHGREFFFNFCNVLIDGVEMQRHFEARPGKFILWDAVAAIGLDPFRLPFVQQLWFVRALTVLVVVSPVLKCFANLKGLVCLWIAYLLLRPWGGPGNVGGYLLANLFHNTDLNNFFRICLSAEGMFYFTCGIYLRFNVVEFTRRRFLLCCLAGLALLILFAYCDAKHIMFGGKYFRMIALPFVLAVIWYLIPNRKFPNWLTASAFPIFLCHRCALFFLNSIVHIPQIWLLEVLAAVILSVIASLAFRKIAPDLSALYFGGR